jgi:hypothetical protein
MYFIMIEVCNLNTIRGILYISNHIIYIYISRGTGHFRLLSHITVPEQKNSNGSCKQYPPNKNSANPFVTAHP